MLLCCSTLLSSTELSEKKGIGTDVTTYIDAHNHLFGGGRFPDYSGAVRSALARMDQLGIQKILVMPPPFSFGQRGIFDIDDFISVVKKYPDRIAFLGGGGSLNATIQQAAKSGSVSQEMKAEFEKKANEIISKGAVGFGEFAVEHFSFNFDHPYESASADNPLFLLLADIAARYDVPIDIHMEAIPKDMPLPGRDILKRSGINPKLLRENISVFERLLVHNPKTKIIWAHVGWCNTGFRTTDLCRKMLSKYPNLYMSFKLSPESVIETRPISEDLKSIKAEWLQLIKDFPDRFIIGTDQFYVTPGAGPIGPQKTEATRLFMNLLPPDLSQKIGIENPIKIFNLKDK
jgi:predicted TIM-barrel fold metal-dependent hydrolase